MQSAVARLHACAQADSRRESACECHSAPRTAYRHCALKVTEVPHQVNPFRECVCSMIRILSAAFPNGFSSRRVRDLFPASGHGLRGSVFALRRVEAPSSVNGFSEEWRGSILRCPDPGSAARSSRRPSSCAGRAVFSGSASSSWPRSDPCFDASYGFLVGRARVSDAALRGASCVSPHSRVGVGACGVHPPRGTAPCRGTAPDPGGSIGHHGAAHSRDA
jgi:hypothetical protein